MTKPVLPPPPIWRGSNHVCNECSYILDGILQEARADVKTLMMSPTLIVSPQKNSPVMGIVQDSLLGAQRMSQRDVFMSRDVFFSLLLWMENWDGKVPAPAVMVKKKLRPGERPSRRRRFTPYWTGKQAFTLIMPKINMLGKTGKITPSVCQAVDCKFGRNGKPAGLSTVGSCELQSWVCRSLPHHTQLK